MKFDKINFKNIKITQEFVRLHAHICADGYIEKTHSKRSEKSLIDHPRKNLIQGRYYVRYVNKENILVNQFIKDVKSVFGRKVTKLRRFEYEVCGKWIYDIFYNLGAVKNHPSEMGGMISSASHSGGFCVNATSDSCSRHASPRAIRVARNSRIPPMMGGFRALLIPPIKDWWNSVV